MLLSFKMAFVKYFSVIYIEKRTPSRALVPWDRKGRTWHRVCMAGRGCGDPPVLGIGTWGNISLLPWTFVTALIDSKTAVWSCSLAQTCPQILNSNAVKHMLTLSRVLTEESLILGKTKMKQEVVQTLCRVLFLFLCVRIGLFRATEICSSRLNMYLNIYAPHILQVKDNTSLKHFETFIHLQIYVCIFLCVCHGIIFF